MKKLLGVSFVAMLLVCPMMANAAGEQTASKMDAAPAANNAALATAGFVKGAYTATKTHVDAIVDDITVGAYQGEGSGYNAISAGKSVAENLKLLDSHIGSLESGSVTQQALETALEPYATQGQVVATIKAATVTTVTDWTANDGAPSTASVTVDGIHNPS